MSAPTQVLVTGASGFVGSRVVTALTGVDGVGVRALTHRAALPAGAVGPRVQEVRGDVGDAASLVGLCDGIDVVVHCASLISGEAHDLRRVNDVGTRVLVEEAQRAGVRRVVSLSTSAVYGRGPFVRLRPERARPAPGSPTSESRAAADEHVLAAGGVVLRPHLVYGAGDRWVVPGLASLLRAALPAGVDLGKRHSLVDVRTLGAALARAAVTDRELRGVYHVNHPEPVTGEDVVATVAGALGLPVRRAGTQDAAAEAAPHTRHHLAMLGVDHWFDDARTWRDLGCDPGPAFGEAFGDHAPWYRAHLS